MMIIEGGGSEFWKHASIRKSLFAETPETSQSISLRIAVLKLWTQSS